jgi:hypothetical protein
MSTATGQIQLYNTKSSKHFNKFWSTAMDWTDVQHVNRLWSNTTVYYIKSTNVCKYFIFISVEKAGIQSNPNPNPSIWKTLKLDDFSTVCLPVPGHSCDCIVVQFACLASWGS